MSNQKIKTVWLRNTTNGLVYEVPEEEVNIYRSDKEKVAIATEKEVKAFQEGTYWSNLGKSETKQVEPKKQAKNKNQPKAEESNEELLEKLLELDPKTDLDAKSSKEDILAAISLAEEAKTN
jgi:hypothetical protein